METLKAIQNRNSVAHLTEPAPSPEEMEEVYKPHQEDNKNDEPENPYLNLGNITPNERESVQEITQFQKLDQIISTQKEDRIQPTKPMS